METKLERILEDLSLEDILSRVDMSSLDALLILHNNGYIDLTDLVDELFGLPTEE